MTPNGPLYTIMQTNESKPKKMCFLQVDTCYNDCRCFARQFETDGPETVEVRSMISGPYLFKHIFILPVFPKPSNQSLGAVCCHKQAEGIACLIEHSR